MTEKEFKDAWIPRARVEQWRLDRYREAVARRIAAGESELTFAMWHRLALDEQVERELKRAK